MWKAEAGEKLMITLVIQLGVKKNDAFEHGTNQTIIPPHVITCYLSMLTPDSLSSSMVGQVSVWHCRVVWC